MTNETTDIGAFMLGIDEASGFVCFLRGLDGSLSAWGNSAAYAVANLPGELTKDTEGRPAFVTTERELDVVRVINNDASHALVVTMGLDGERGYMATLCYPHKGSPIAGPRHYTRSGLGSEADG